MNNGVGKQSTFTSSQLPLKPTKISNIYKHLEDLEYEVKELSSSIQSLVIKLEPILSPEPVEDFISVSLDNSSSSPLSQRIQQLNITTENCHKLLGILNKRLDI
jgi:hypothetical protein